jgi:hypothetical protein
VLLLCQLSQVHSTFGLSTSVSLLRGSRLSLARLNNLHLAINLNGNDHDLSVKVIITFELAYKASATKMVELECFRTLRLLPYAPVHLPGVGLASSRRNNSDYSLVKELLYRAKLDISCICNFRLIRFGAANHMDRFAVVNGSGTFASVAVFSAGRCRLGRGERYRLIRPCQRPSLLSVKKARRRRRVVVRRTRTSYERETFGRPTGTLTRPRQDSLEHKTMVRSREASVR